VNKIYCFVLDSEALNFALLKECIMFSKSICIIVTAASLLCLAQQASADEKPLVFALQKQKNPGEIQQSADVLAKALSQNLKREVKVLVPGDYSATVQALVSKQADVGYLSSLPYLLARRDGDAKLLMVEARPDKNGVLQTSYNSVLAVRADSPIQNWQDIAKSASTLRLVYTSQTSASGYVFPLGYFRQEGLVKSGEKAENVFKQVAYAGGYSQALQQVLAGNADVVAVSDYTLEGANTKVYITDEDRAKLRIVTRIPGVPTHLIATRGGMSEAEREQIAKALETVSSDNPNLLKDVYGAAKLIRSDEQKHVGATIKAVELSGIPISGLAK
jgi:phosphonate transport system substrate-binding protein